MLKLILKMKYSKTSYTAFRIFSKFNIRLIKHYSLFVEKQNIYYLKIKNTFQ